MKLTTNYSLKKPEGSDVVNIDDFNYNTDTIDTKLKAIETQANTNKSNISSNTTLINANKTSILNGQTIKVTSDDGTCIDVSGQDADNLDKTGFYMGEGMLNVPQTQYGWVYIENKVHKKGEYQIQIATELHNSSNRWTRHITNITGWSNWKRINIRDMIDVSIQPANGWNMLVEHSTVRCWGNVVSINVIFEMGNGIKDAGTTIATIDSAYAPQKLITTSSFSSTKSFVGCFDIKTTGSIKVSDADALNNVAGTFGINVTYLID